MAITLESSPAASLDKGLVSFTNASSTLSPSSDQRFWTTLRGRVDTLLENKKPPIDQSLGTQMKDGEMECSKRLNEDKMLLMRGFDSVAHSLSQLTNNLENALQGARDLGKPPTLTEIFHCTMEKAKGIEENPKKEAAGEDSGKGNRGIKRKHDSKECSEDQVDDSRKDNGQCSRELGKFSKAKNLAISMARNAAALARELRSVKSDVSFMQERCNLLEEENRRLHEGYGNGIQPEEDDLMRLQMETLLAEKSRLANENTNLTRENQSLRELVEYHQLTSQDLSASYENLIKEMGLEFPLAELGYEEEKEDNTSEDNNADLYKLSKKLDNIYDEL